MTDTAVQFNVDQLQYRTATVEAFDVDQGTVECVLVSYEREALVDEGLAEVFTRGAFKAACGNPSRVKVTDQQHNRGVVIGHAVDLDDRTDGLYGNLRVADTAAGRDVLTLLRCGTLTELSIEFRAQRQHMRYTRRADDLLVRHDRAVLVGVSPVSAGAYGEGSRVLSVRDSARQREREQLLARLSALQAGAHRR